MKVGWGGATGGEHGTACHEQVGGARPMGQACRIDHQEAAATGRQLACSQLQATLRALVHASAYPQPQMGQRLAQGVALP